MIRTDFVSNSSSSSFVICVKHTKEYPFKNFVKDIVDDTVRVILDEDFKDEEYIQNVIDTNYRNLHYHLKTSELLFLGIMVSDYHRITINIHKDKSRYDIYNKWIHDNCLDDIRLISHTDEEIVVEIPDYDGGGLSISHYDMVMLDIRNSYLEQEKLSTDERRVKNIIKCIRENRDVYHTGLYTITANTVKNTKLLLKFGYKIILPYWVTDLDELDNMLSGNNSLYYIKVNLDGDGLDHKSVYSFGSWKHEFNNENKYHIISSDRC